MRSQLRALLRWWRRDYAEGFNDGWDAACEAFRKAGVFVPGLNRLRGGGTPGGTTEQAPGPDAS